MRVNTAISLLIVCLCVSHCCALQKDQPYSDYDEPLPNDADPNAPKDAKAGDAAGSDSPDKLGAEPEEEDNSHRTRFSDDRFAKLFPTRTSNRGFVAKDVHKPKPTLPSFIKNTPPIVKAQFTTPAPRAGRATARSLVSTTPSRSGRLSTTTTQRPNRNNQSGRLAQSTPRPLSGRLSSVRPTAGPSISSSTSPSAAALAARRRPPGQNGGISRFQRPSINSPAANQNNDSQANNSTIPALPRRH